jgi:alginate O-acetyltransferase complex protein AlgI
MLFASPLFLFLFLPFVLLGYFLIPKFKNLFLLIASLFFYVWGEGIYVVYLLFVIVVNYFLGIVINRRSNYRKIFFISSVCINVSLLIYFKYTVFFIDVLEKLLGNSNLLTTIPHKIHMPLGVSFVTFHILSYLFDIYRKEIKAEKNILHFGLYISMFPHLIAGPIVRFADIGKQIKKPKIDLDSIHIGVNRFVTGLGKKVIIANSCAHVADRIFAIFPHQLSPSILWLGLIAYTFQIFFDFSGYSDMAIGLAQIFGFRFNENFNYPYSATSIQDFWRRWHMTLSSWFRDYVYISLGGSREGTIRTYLNILFVFLLTGFWHGASWNFIFWGVYYGAFLVFERSPFGVVIKRSWRPFQHVYTLGVVMIGWLFFRVENIRYAFFLLKMLFGFERAIAPGYTVNIFLTNEFMGVLILASVFSIPLAPLFSKHRRVLLQKISPFIDKDLYALKLGKIVIVACILLYSIFELASGTYNPFIYFRF